MIRCASIESQCRNTGSTCKLAQIWVCGTIDKRGVCVWQRSSKLPANTLTTCQALRGTNPIDGKESHRGLPSILALGLTSCQKHGTLPRQRHQPITPMLPKILASNNPIGYMNNVRARQTWKMLIYTLCLPSKKKDKPYETFFFFFTTSEFQWPSNLTLPHSI